MGTYTNADGLEILTGNTAGTAVANGYVAPAGEKKTLTVDLSVNAAGSVDPNAVGSIRDADAFIPAGSFITGAYLKVTTAFASGGVPTLSIGVAQQDGTVIDADGIDATIALAALAAGSGIVCDGALVAGTVTVGGNNAYVYCTTATSTYTAGAAELVIEYI